MIKRNKQALLILTVSIPSFYFGVSQFELGQASSLTIALLIATSITLGGVGIVAGVTMLFTKNRLGWFDDNDPIYKSIIKKGEKPMAKKKANLMKDEQDAVLSVDLMKREKELETRRKELESLLAEVSKEEKAVEKKLIEKGWVNKNGSWGIE